MGTADEEIGMDGSLAAKNAGIMENCDFVLIGEPTELKIGIAEKGTLWIKVAVTGKSAHGSTPHLGISAIEGAAKLLQRMKEAVPELDHSVLGKSSLNIGKISGGTLINVVPEYCEFECDFRLVDDNLREQTKKKISEIIEKFNNEQEAQAEIEIMHEIPAMELKEESAFVELLKTKAKDKHILTLLYICRLTIVSPPTKV